MMISSVLQVAFNPQHPDKFISSSTDGIISVFDFSEHFDEEESFIVSFQPSTQTCNSNFKGHSKSLLIHLGCTMQLKGKKARQTKYCSCNACCDRFSNS